jgi:6-phospho-3-hexuloisomerase
MSQYSKNIDAIFRELEFVLSAVNSEEIDDFVTTVIAANKIVVYGAGRVGYAIRGFGMRLAHLGFNAFTLGDSVVPAIGKGDLLIIASGSGETQTVYDIALIGKENKAKIAVVTGNPKSRIAGLADTVIVMKAPSKSNELQGLKSIQPMSTLNEQCLQLLFDAIVLDIMSVTNQTHDDMYNRHSNLE